MNLEELAKDVIEKPDGPWPRPTYTIAVTLARALLELKEAAKKANAYRPCELVTQLSPPHGVLTPGDLAFRCGGCKACTLAIVIERIENSHVDS